MVEISATQSASDGKPSVRGKYHSAVTTGGRLHVVRPGDNAWGRQFRDVYQLIISDLGGRDAGLSEGQRQLARRCATIAIECEKMEGDAAAGAEICVERYGALTDRLGRAFQRLGLQRRARDITTGPTLGELMLADIADRQREAGVETVDASIVDLVPDTAQDKTLRGESRKGGKRASKKHPEAKPDDGDADPEEQPA